MTTVAVSVLVGALVFSGCSAASEPNPQLPAPQRLRVEVLEARAHDQTAFTQGLELAGGALYEGTGLVGASTLREVDPVSGTVRRRVDVPSGYFGEGITVVGDSIWQLTWQDGVAIKWRRGDFSQERTAEYKGEGWGLCHDGSRLVMSDGSGTLTFRDPATFAERGRLAVRRADAEVTRLNELECAGGAVWANVWQTDEILRIDPATGAVTAVVDASRLLPEAQRNGADVLNGIAAVPGTEEFLLTGKLWPSLFRVKFVPVRQN
ncbi:glutaminyl-peptide cyclotransferase [Crossiella equi]|uniref:glutaminyl-peptide cyclotransferase n=1 Tax=Crossiella equi TaxID=130796 RepID=UPI000A3CA3D3|nr:glutaminyl-peptide cyclotransferase [Crossiella equi]